MQKIDIDEKELSVSTEAEQNLADYRNIALFGIDSRDSSLGKGNRSDCIIIASLNNKTKEVKLISVYRDTYMKIEGHGLDKVTHAYSYGEAPLAIKTLNENMDLNIKEFVTVNFDAVADAVNALGGVTIDVISVYRDTYMKIEGHGLDKVTHAYSYGEAPLAIKTLNENMDLNIKEFVTVNFDAVADAVNALGGVTIDVEQNEIQYINSYIKETSRVTGLKTENVTKPGKQTLDGVQAVAYSRIRYTEGGDQKRAKYNI